MSTQGLTEALFAITEDALFALCGSAHADLDVLRGLSKRRAGAYEQIARGGHRVGPTDFSKWVGELSTALAPVQAPNWMPMAEVVDAGVSLEAGARGVRSLFTSKPSESDIERVKRLGAFAVRATGCVLGADGPLSEDETFVRQALVASLALPDAQAQLLLSEPPMPVEAIEVPADIDAKLARAFVRGAWLAAARDGFDPREERAVLALSQRLRLPATDAEALRADARTFVEARRALGAAALDALRFMLADADEASAPLANALLPLLLPPAHQAEARASFEQDATITLAKRHQLDRDGKALVLSLAWLAALHRNPTLTRRAQLIGLHETIAADLDAVGAGSSLREELDAFVESELLAASRVIEKA